MSENKPIILVTGATGSQGGSVCRHLLKSGKYKVRALTRNPTSEKAKELEKLGCEIVKGDLYDKESLKKAFDGVYGVFGVTFFWNTMDPKKEFEEGKNLMDAAKEANVKHFVFSALEDTDKTKFKVPHFAVKGQIAEYMEKLGIPNTQVMVAFYMDNWLGMLKPQKNKDGVYEFVYPMGDKKLDTISIEDLGGIVTTIFDYPTEHIGKKYGVAGDSLTISQIAEKFTKATGKPAKYVEVPVEKYKTFYNGAEEMGEMFAFYQEMEGKLRDVNLSKKLYPKMKSVEEFFKEYKSAF